MEHIIKILKNLGLDEKEIKVYLACLQLGSATVQDLSIKSGVKRTNIYNFIDDMKQRGMLSETKLGKRILFVAEDPEIVIKNLKQNVAKLDIILPDLKSIFNYSGDKPKIKFYQGRKGLLQTYEDSLLQKEPIYAFSDFETMLKVAPDELWDYVHRRVEKGISFKAIGLDGTEVRKAMKKNRGELREIKLVKNIKFDTDINIYGNRVALMSFRRPYMGIIIEDVAIALTLKTVWKLLWERL